MKPTAGRKTKFIRDRIATLVWTVGLAVSLLLYWWVMSNYVIRDFWDPQYVMKMERLKARVAENPGRPLWLVMGSSRVERGLRAGILDEGATDKNAPMIFNFGLGGGGMFREFICLRRLLDAGFKPREVGIEIVGGAMSREMFEESNSPNLLVRARRNELKDYLEYSDDPAMFITQWRLSRWDPAYKYGIKVPGQTLAWRLIPLPGVRHLESVPYDKWGWFPQPPAPIPEDDYHRAFEIAKTQFQDKFMNFQISRKTDVPLRRMLEMCRNAGIGVFLLRMPENSDFRAFYTPGANVVIEAYLAKIEGEYGVPMIDATMWIGGGGFTDGHHLNATGAEEFTRRFGAELSALKH
jgi:hypothetical protein